MESKLPAVIENLVNGIDQKYGKLGKRIKIANKQAIPELINLEDKAKEQELAEKIMVEINKNLRAKKCMSDQDTMSFKPPADKPERVVSKVSSQTRTPANRNPKENVSPPGLTVEHLK